MNNVPPSPQSSSAIRKSRRSTKFESSRRFLSRLASRRAQRRIAALTALLLASGLSFTTSLRADDTWTGAGGNSLWSNAANWTNGAPTTAPFGTLTFATTTGSPSFDDIATLSENVLLDTAGAFTINGATTVAAASASVINLYDNGGAQAKIENNGTAGTFTLNNITVNFAATSGAAFGEINAVTGDILFGATNVLNVNGSQVAGIRMYGSNHNTTFNGTVNATGKYFAMTGASDIMNVGGAFASADLYVMNGGTLNLTAGGVITNDSLTGVRLGGDFSTTGAQDLTKSGTFNLAVTTGAQTFAGVINSVAGNTSGALSVNALNTSGTDTLSGHLALDSNLTISEAAGTGTLAITQARSGTTTTTGTDVKASTLTFNAGAGSNINVSGTIYDSTAGGGGIAKTGTGTLTLSGTNTYTGGTTISAGTAASTAAAGFGTGAVAIGSAGTALLNFNGNAANVFTGTGNLTTTGGGNNVTFTSATALNGFTGTLNLNTTGNGKTNLTTAGQTIGSGATVNVGANATLFVQNTAAGGNNFSGVTFNLNGTGNGEGLGALRLEGGNIGATSTVNLLANSAIGGNNTTSTIAAPITGAGFGFSKVGNNQISLSGTNTYTGATTVSGGTLAFTGTGSSASSAATDLGNQQLLFNATGNTTATTTRLASVTLGNTSGTNPGTNGLVLSNTGNTTATTDAITGNITLSNSTAGSTGVSNILFAAVTTAGASETLTASGLIVQPGAVANIFATSGTLGTNAFFKLTNGPTQIGAGGTAATFTQSVVPYAYSSNGGVLTYDATNGFVKAATTGTVTSGGSTLINYGGGGIVLTGGVNTTLNSVYTSGNITGDAGSTLTVNSGVIYANAPLTISVPTLALNSTGYFGNAGRAVTISSVITGSNGVNFFDNQGGGTGVTTLTGANTYSGVTNIDAGGNGFQLVLANTNALQNSTLNLTSGSIAIGNSTNNVTALNLGGLSGTQNINLTNGFTTPASVALTVGSDGDSTTYSGVIANGTVAGGSLTKTGSGTLTLTNTNTYSGGTTITGGAISVATDAYLGTAGITLNGGTLRFTNTSALTDTHVITVGAAGGTISETGAATANQASRVILNTANLLVGSGNLTVSGNGTLGGTLGTTNTGAGALVLNQSNTFSGNVTLQNGGLIEYGNASSLASTATVTLGNEGEFAIDSGLTAPQAVTVTGGTNSVISFNNGTAASSGNITLNANLTVGLRNWYNYGGSQSGTLSGTISGAGGLITTGGGTLTLSGPNTYSGGTTTNAGGLKLGSSSVGAPGSITSGPLGTGSYSVNNTTVDLNGQTLANALVSGGNGDVFTNSSATTANVTSGFNQAGTNGVVISDLTVNGTGNINWSGAIRRTNFVGTVNKSGANTFTLAGAGGDYTNMAYNVTGGNLAFNLTGGTFNSGTISVATGTGVIGAEAAGTTSTIASVIQGAGSFTQTGAGTTVLTGTDTYSGGTTISAGTLQLGDGTTNGTVVGNITDNSVLAFNYGTANSPNYGGVISGTGSVVKAGAGTLFLSGTNTETGTLQVQNGILALASSTTYLTSSGGTGTATLGTSGAANNTVISISNNGRTFANPIATTGTGGSNSIQTNGSGQNFTFSGGATLGNDLTFSTVNGSDSITETGAIGGTGNLITSVSTTGLGGLNTAGATYGTGGTITLSGGVNNVGTVTNNGNGSAGVTISGNIGTNVTGVVENSANSSLTLTGTNTYTSGTTVNAGMLIVGAGVSPTTNLGTGLVTINTGGTLQLVGLGGPINAASTFYTTNAITLNGGTIFANDGIQHLGENSTATTFSTITVGAGGGTILSQYGNKDVYLDGVLTGSGPLTIADVADGFGAFSTTHVTNAANTYTGTVTVNETVGNGVRLQIDRNAALASATINPNANNANAPSTVLFGAGVTAPVVGALSGAGNIALADQAGTPAAVVLTTGGNNASTAYSGVLSGAGGLTKAGSGTMTLSGASTYTGATRVTGGTLSLTTAGTNDGSGTITGGTLKGTTSVTVTGGTLLLSASNAINPGVSANSGSGNTNTITPVGLGGGTLGVANGVLQGQGSVLTGGAPGGGQSVAGLGTLTLTANASLSFLGTSGTVVFNFLVDTTNAVLNVTGTNFGSASGDSADGVTDRLIFFEDIQGAGLLGKITFNGSTAAQEIDLGDGSFEIVPTAVPEVATWVGGLLSLVGAGAIARRRVGGMIKAMVAR